MDRFSTPRFQIVIADTIGMQARCQATSYYYPRQRFSRVDLEQKAMNYFNRIIITFKNILSNFQNIVRLDIICYRKLII